MTGVPQSPNAPPAPELPPPAPQPYYPDQPPEKQPEPVGEPPSPQEAPYDDPIVEIPPAANCVRQRSLMETAMLHRVACVLILSAFMFLPTAIRAQDASRDVVGVWKVIGAETKEVVSGKVAKPFGDYPIGTFFFSRGGRMAGMLFGANRKTAAGANATDAERAALFASMSAYSGIYKVDGKKLLVAIENSSVQSWNGTQRIFNIEIAGGKLTGTSDPFKSLTSGLDVVAVVTWEKVE